MQPQPSKLMPGLWGGVVVGLLSGIPVLNFINCACCLGVMIGGSVAVYLYRNSLDPGQPVLMSDGALLGLLAGVFGAIIGNMLEVIFGAITYDALLQLAQYIDNPEFQEVLDEIRPILTEGGFILVTFFIGLVIDFFIFSIFGLFGGMIGVSLFGAPKVQPSLDVSKDWSPDQLNKK